jgi:hypothetical protein
MEDTYYFSQGRLVYTGPYTKFKDDDKVNTKDFATDAKKNNATSTSKNTTAGGTGGASGTGGVLYKILNFQLYNKSVLRYKL